MPLYWWVLQEHTEVFPVSMGGGSMFLMKAMPHFKLPLHPFVFTWPFELWLICNMMVTCDFYSCADPLPATGKLWVLSQGLCGQWLLCEFVPLPKSVHRCSLHGPCHNVHWWNTVQVQQFPGQWCRFPAFQTVTTGGLAIVFHLISVCAWTFSLKAERVWKTWLSIPRDKIQI